MRLPQDRLANIKKWIHLAQAIVLFLAWALTIGVFTASGKEDGRIGWYFGLCWLTIPILVYLAMVPQWSRARRFSNIYAFAVLDTLSIVLWLSAWAAVTSYVASGKGQGTNTDKNASGCDNFKNGSATKCRLSEATIVLGVIIDLLFVPTAYVSFKAVMEYKRTGVLPNQQELGAGGAGPLGGSKPISNLDDEAFDSNINARSGWEVDEYDHDDYHRDPRQGGGNYAYQRAEVHDEDEYTGALAAHSRNTSEVMPGHSYDDLSHTGPTMPSGPLGQETEYRSGGYR